MRDDLVKVLAEGGHSLVVRNETVSVYDGHGITDLYRLLRYEPEMLRGGIAADKVVGKAAMALMMLGGVREVYAAVISDLALSLAERSTVAVSYGKRVGHIARKDGTGWCPLEFLCKECATARECLAEIDKFMYADKPCE